MTRICTRPFSLSSPVLWIGALLALILHVWLYPYANPTAALRLRVSRNDVASRAQRFLTHEHIRIPTGYQRAVTFHTASDTKGYLEQTLGLSRANRVMQTEGFVYAWEVRWFKPGAQREYYVYFDPDGRLLAFDAVLPDDAPASPTNDPQQVARAFLRRTMDIDVSAYTLKEHAVSPRPNRRDYDYTWERPRFLLGKATQRIDVTVTGNRVIACNRYLEIPQAFIHRFAREQEKGNLLAEIAFALHVIFICAGIVILIAGFIRRTLCWRQMLLPAILVAAVGLVNSINTLPLEHAAYDVTDTDVTFWTHRLMGIALSSVGTFFSILFLVTAAEWIYRRAFPEQTPIAWWFTRRGLSSAEGRTRLRIGYGILLAHLAYASIFYAIAERYFHGWSPADVPYDDLFSTAAPWAYALLIGIEAAVTEEFLFRVLAISWLKRVLKCEWLAILIPAVIWAFAHCNYPNQPFFIRGIELTVVGVAFGIIFVRLGPLPTLLSHAGFNAILVGESLLRSVIWHQRLHALAVLLAVLLPLALAWWWKRGRGVDDETPANNAALETELADAAAALPPPEPVTDNAPPYRPLPSWVWPATLAPVLLCVVLAWLLHRQDGDAGAYTWSERPSAPFQARSIDRLTAMRIAEKAVIGQGADVRGWVVSAVSDTEGVDEETEAYLAQYLSANDADALVARTVTPEFLWVVKWQKPLARETWEVRLRADGKMWDVRHGLPDEAAGARLTEPEARQLALQALRQQGFTPSRFRLTGTDREDHPQRTTYLFTWEPKTLRVGKAQFLTRVSVDGDRVNRISRSIVIPDSYRFEREKEPPVLAIISLVSVLLTAALLCWACWIAMTTLRRYAMPWKWNLGAAAVMAVLLLGLSLLSIPTVVASLPSTLAPGAFAVGAAVSMLAAVVMPVALLCIGLTISIPLWRAHMPDMPDPRFWWGAVLRPWRQAPVWRDAILIQPLLFAVAMSGVLAKMWVNGMSGGVDRSQQISMPPWLLTMPPPPDPPGLPALDSVAPLVFALVLPIAALVFAFACWIPLVAIGKRLFHGSYCALGVVTLLIGLPVIANLYSGASLLPSLLSIAGLLLFLLLYRCVFRWNPLIVPLGVAGVLLCYQLMALLEFRAYHLPAFILLLALPLLYLATLASAQRAAARERAAERRRRYEPTIETPPAVISPEALETYRQLQRQRALGMLVATDMHESMVTPTEAPEASCAEENAHGTPSPDTHPHG